MVIQLIVTADDFGASESINSAVALARRDGLLTTVSLMIGRQAAQSAVEIARRDPNLAVGLHVDLFGRDPFSTALGYYFNKGMRRQVKSKLEAQFEAFASTGLPLSHVDGHWHSHAHPAILPHVVDLAVCYGARGIRIPRDPFWPNICVDSSKPVYKLVVALGQAYLSWVCERGLYGAGLVTCDLSIGNMMSGRMTDRYVIGMLQCLKDFWSKRRSWCDRLSYSCPSVEVFFHPSIVGGASDPFGPNPGDLAALISPELKKFVDENGFELATYAGLLSQRVERGNR